MVRSLFSELIEKYFPIWAGNIEETINGEATEPTMMHRTMLTEEYSADLTWGSTDFNRSIVAADVVSLESSLPLKKRDTIESASGTIPKLGLKFERGEKFISDINVMKAKGVKEAQIAAKVMDDTTKCFDGIEVRKEIMFEQAFSTGMCLIKDGSMYAGNDGTGIRVDFGYKAENADNAAVTWGQSGATPVSDLRKRIDAAATKGVTVNHIWLNRSDFEKLRTSDEGKQLAATFNGVVITGASLPVPGRTQFMDALADEFGITVHIVTGTFREMLPNGNFNTVTPWEDGIIVLTTGEQVGRLVYGTLAEETNPVNDVDYQKIGSHTLISKFGKTDPLVEFTAGQALCLPVIDDVRSIFRLNTTQAITLGGTDISDGVVAVPKTAISGASSKVVTTSYAGYGTLSATSSQTWCTPTVDGTSIKIATSANSASSAPKRTCTVTVTDGIHTAKFTVEQAANS